MKILEYNRNQAHLAFDKWKYDKELPSLPPEYAAIRSDMTQFFSDIYGKVSGDDRKEYMIDTLFIGKYNIDIYEVWQGKKKLYQVNILEFENKKIKA